ncbi:MAG: hypothetical protein ACPGUD_12690, partial [Parashewanella sp.]
YNQTYSISFSIAIMAITRSDLSNMSPQSTATPEAHLMAFQVERQKLFQTSKFNELAQHVDSVRKLSKSLIDIPPAQVDAMEKAINQYDFNAVIFMSEGAENVAALLYLEDKITCRQYINISALIAIRRSFKTVINSGDTAFPCLSWAALDLKSDNNAGERKAILDDWRLSSCKYKFKMEDALEDPKVQRFDVIEVELIEPISDSINSSYVSGVDLERYQFLQKLEKSRCCFIVETVIYDNSDYRSSKLYILLPEAVEAVLSFECHQAVSLIPFLGKVTAETIAQCRKNQQHPVIIFNDGITNNDDKINGLNVNGFLMIYVAIYYQARLTKTAPPIRLNLLAIHDALMKLCTTSVESREAVIRSLNKPELKAPRCETPPELFDENNIRASMTALNQYLHKYAKAQLTSRQFLDQSFLANDLPSLYQQYSEHHKSLFSFSSSACLLRYFIIDYLCENKPEAIEMFLMMSEHSLSIQQGTSGESSFEFSAKLIAYMQELKTLPSLSPCFNRSFV